MASQEHTVEPFQVQVSDTSLQQSPPGHCLVCGIAFRPSWYRETQLYCSKSCLGIAFKGPQKTCLRCGAPRHLRGTRRKYCSTACWYASVRESAEADFWAKVDKGPHSQGCWLWTGYVRKAKMNYGEHRGDYVHRYAYQLYHPDEVLTEDDVICHTCDICPCVLDAHLFKGTQLDNVHDAVAKGRIRKGERVTNAKLTEEQVRSILFQWHQGGVTEKGLSRCYPVSPSAIHMIVSGRNWRHVYLDMQRAGLLP